MTDDMVSPDAPEWEGMTADHRQGLIEAAEASRVQRKGVDRIFKIGKGFEILQLEAMHRSHSNNPTGIRYNQAYKALERIIPELDETSYNKTDRNQYIWCWQHREALERWWASKGQRERDRWGHPDAVKRHYLADTVEPKERPTEPAAPSVAVDPAELDHLKRKIAHDERSETGNPATENPQAAGDAMFEQILQETKAGVGAALKRARAYANQIIKRVRESERNLAKGRPAEVVVRKAR